MHLKIIIKKAVQIRNPFEQSLFLLVHLSYLQAFTDVNKRTARLAANISLIVGNLVPLSFNDIEKDDYISAVIAIYELQDVRPIADLYAFSYMRTCAAYDSTMKALGFDEIRVRYRQERRMAIREIIEDELIGAKLKKYIHSKAILNIPKQAQEKFIENLIEDLNQMDECRIAGLGITLEQLKVWLKLYKPI
jgi:Fic family protein